MPKSPPDDGSSPDPTLESGFDEVQPDGARAPMAQPVPPAKRTDPEWVEATDTVTRPLAPAALDDEGPPEPAARGPRRPSRSVQVGAIAAVVVLLVGAALLYRSHHRRQVLAKGLAHAERVARADTYAGYREASQVLEPLVPIDPIAAGAARAWALAMLATDYRDARAAQDAEGLLVEPERATEVPPAANLALAALALGRQKAGTAATYAARPGGGALAHVLQARVAFLAGNPAGAVEPLDAALAAEPRLAAALALRGDALRRTRNPAAARQAYLSALEASPLHPRAAYGLAKLALSGQARPEEAIPNLERILGDRAGTPSNERGRAALHLAALKGRGGDRAGAQGAIGASGATGAERAWLEKAVAEEELSRTGYRVIDGAPPGLLSASDDDPYEPPPPPPPAPAVKKAAAKPAAKKAPAKAGKATKRAKPPAKKGSTKPAAKKSSTTKPPP